MEVNTEGSKTLCKKFPFARKHPTKEGLSLKIVHKNPSCAQNTTQCIRFTQATFNSNGALMAIKNLNGQIFIFDFSTAKFWLLKTVLNCSLIKFSAGILHQLFVGINNGFIYVMDVASGKVMGNLVGHTQTVLEMEFCSDLIHCATLSSQEAIVWNVKKSTKVQVLNASEDNLPKIVKFVPNNNLILACFNNDNIQIWNLKSYHLEKQITSSVVNKISIKTIALSKNGDLMVVAGHSSTIYAFGMPQSELVQMIHLTKSVQTVRKLEFLPLDSENHGKILTILLGNGTIYFYNMQEEAMIAKISNESEIWKFALESTAQRMACVMKMGQVFIYYLNQYTKMAKSANTFKKTQRCSPLVLNSLQQFTSEKKKTTKKQIENILDMDKLKGILREFNEFPELYRKIIWAHILRLPYDVNQCEEILANCFDCPFADFERNYPLENTQDLRNLKRVLIGLVSWCPFFQSVQFLPNLVFPFVKVFQNEPVLAMEALIMILVNYCQHFFEYHPLPPLNLLAIIENVLIACDPAVLHHFNRLQITSKVFAWPLLQTLLSEVLSAEQWLSFWDHVITNEPAFLLLGIASYSLVNKSKLLQLQSREEAVEFYSTISAFDYKLFIKTTYKLLKELNEEYHPRKFLQPIEFFAKKQYLQFNNYPVGCLQVTESVKNLKEQQSKLETEELELKLKSSELLKLKELERLSEECLRRNQLNNFYQEAVIKERQSVNEKRERLQNLRSKIQSEEEEILAMTKRRLLSQYESETALNFYLNHEESGKESFEDFQKVEEELLKQYTNLLKHKLKIEGLLDDNCSLDYVQKRKLHRSKCDRMKRLKDCQGKGEGVDPEKNQEYLKQLNVATGLAAIDSLINKVENEMKSRQKDKLILNDDDDDDADDGSNEDICKLQAESEDLSEEIDKLMKLINQK